MLQILPPVLSVASRILKSVIPAFAKYSPAAKPAIPAPIMMILGLFPIKLGESDVSVSAIWEIVNDWESEHLYL